MFHHTSIYSGIEYMRYKLHMGYNLWDIYIWGYSLWNTSHMGIFFGWYFFYGYLINYGIYSLIIGSSGIYNKHQPTMIPAASWWQPMDGMDIFDIPLGIPLGDFYLSIAPSVKVTNMAFWCMLGIFVLSWLSISATKTRVECARLPLIFQFVA